MTIDEQDMLTGAIERLRCAAIALDGYVDLENKAALGALRVF
jgi:hypothetical protein